MLRRPGAGWAWFGLRLAVLGALVLVALGLSADPPRAASDEPWRLDRLDGPAIGAVLLVALATGLLLLGWGLADRRGSGTLPRRRSRWAGVLFLLVAVALGVLFEVYGPQRGAPEVDLASNDPPPPPPDLGAGGEDGGGSALLVLGLLLAVVVAAGLAARRRGAPAPPPAEEPPADALGQGLAAAAASLRDSAGDEPRLRIIAAYAAFEDALDRAGVRRTPSGTPARLLDEAVVRGAPQQPATVLTDLFTAARYADRRLTLADLGAAERALDELLASR